MDPELELPRLEEPEFPEELPELCTEGALLEDDSRAGATRRELEPSLEDFRPSRRVADSRFPEDFGLLTLSVLFEVLGAV